MNIPKWTQKLAVGELIKRPYGQLLSPLGYNLFYMSVTKPAPAAICNKASSEISPSGLWGKLRWTTLLVLSCISTCTPFGSVSPSAAKVSWGGALTSS